MNSIQETADKLGKHYQTIRNWIKSGYIKAVRIGNEYSISDEEIKRILKGVNRDDI